jgi:hypothetical protein
MIKTKKMKTIKISADRIAGQEVFRFIFDEKDECLYEMKGHTKIKRLQWMLDCLKEEVIKRDFE